MSISIVLPNLRLSTIDLRDQGSIAIVDLSSYSTLPIASNIVMQITPPGWPTVNVPFNPGTVNVYKCADLGIICGVAECCPLPDGIYNIVYTVMNGSTQLATINKTFIKIDQIQCRWMNAFLKVDLECNCDSKDLRKYKEELKGIDLLINGAVAAANTCDDLTATNLYEQADRCIDKIYHKFCLYCGPIPSCEGCS
jgi:hypothetical protein